MCAGRSSPAFAALTEEATLAAVRAASDVRRRDLAALLRSNKLKADALYLLHTVDTKRRAMVFTDARMLTHFEGERSRGRFPSETAIELIPAKLPDLACELREATRSASVEVSPHAGG